MAKSKSKLTALPLGGVGEIGMNLMVYECDQDMVIVDMGISFPDNSTPGADVVLPDIYYVRERIKRLKGIVITHAHEDHIGALPYLWDDLPDVPVYVTPFAKQILRHKLNELGITDGDKRIVEVNPGEQHKIGKFEVEYINVTHSIPEGNSVVLRTPHGNIMHTGDYKFDETPVMGPASNLERLREIGDEGVLAMLSDSTNIFTPGHSGSESDLAERLEKIIAEQKNAIFFATFSSNTYRLLKIAEIAAGQGRKVVYLGRSMRRMIDISKELGFFPKSLKNQVVEPEEAAKLPREKMFIMAAGTQGESNSGLSFLATGEKFKGLQIKPDDTVLMSSKMIPGNERAIFDMINGMMACGAHVIHEKLADVHVSGHGGRDEIRQMYELIRPQIAVPVHGEYAHLMAHKEFAEELGVQQTFLITNGTKVQLGPDNAQILEHETPPFGRVYVDGLNILDDDRFILKERRNMALNGLALVTLPVHQQTGEIAGDPAVITRGLMDESLQPDIIEAAVEEVKGSIETRFPAGVIDDRVQALEVMRQATRRAINRERGRKPLTVPQIIDI